MNTNHDYRLGGMFIALSNIIVYGLFSSQHYALKVSSLTVLLFEGFTVVVRTT